VDRLAEISLAAAISKPWRQAAPVATLIKTSTNSNVLTLQNAEAGRNLRPQVRRPRTITSQHRRVHRGVLQSAADAFCAELLIPGRIRAQGRRPTRISWRTDAVFCEQRERRKDLERAAGDGDSNAVPFPRPLLLLGDARTLLRKRKLCPKKLCHLRGSSLTTPAVSRGVFSFFYLVGSLVFRCWAHPYICAGAPFC
jgi:hypothetical protein